MYVAEFDLAARDLQGVGIRAVGHLAVLAQQFEHALHVDDRLLDFADEVAQRVAAFGDAGGGHPHDQSEADRDEGGLAHVQDRQADLAAHRGAFVAGQRGVVAACLVLFVAEVFDGFVVQQAFDGFGVGLGVGLVHLAPELGAPLGDDKRIGHVQDHRRAGGQRQPDVEHLPQHDADQADFKERRQDVEQQERQ
ncbi:hypothetical protein G6F31_017878 [Rhizopus arrhizus]|nr:hypothetical protein G6F31_017878 [Rhizopus arrhizus]